MGIISRNSKEYQEKIVDKMQKAIKEIESKSKFTEIIWNEELVASKSPITDEIKLDTKIITIKFTYL